jgi:hypothetical protein
MRVASAGARVAGKRQERPIPHRGGRRDASLPPLGERLRRLLANRSCIGVQPKSVTPGVPSACIAQRWRSKWSSCRTIPPSTNANAA